MGYGKKSWELVVCISRSLLLRYGYTFLDVLLMRAFEYN